MTSTTVVAAGKATVYVVYYSMYGHMKQMAKEVVKGVKETGADVKLWQIHETLPEEILGKMHAPPKDPEVPYITAADFPAADAIIFGFPTRFGSTPAQVRTLFDSTGQLWAKGALVGKIASVFFGTATQGGGQETTALTTYPFFAHHGMIIVPIGYSCPSIQFEMSEIHGGSPYGAGCYAGADGSRQPSAKELQLAYHQGSYVATIANKLKAGSPVGAAAK